jgi:hypothetical protein
MYVESFICRPCVYTNMHVASTYVSLTDLCAYDLHASRCYACMTCADPCVVGVSLHVMTWFRTEANTNIRILAARIEAQRTTCPPQAAASTGSSQNVVVYQGAANAFVPADVYMCVHANTCTHMRVYACLHTPIMCMACDEDRGDFKSLRHIHTHVHTPQTEHTKYVTMHSLVDSC